MSPFLIMINQFSNFECKKLSLTLGGKVLFLDFHFEFKGPGIIFIEGDNGTGKSSLLKAFAGFIISDGQISYSDHFIDDIGPADFSFFTATSLGLLNDLNGREHIEIVSKSMKLDSKIVETKILEFQKIDIFNEILIKPVSDFSQGMKQCLRLFLHLFFEPKIIFLDEPFLYLSPRIKEFFQHKIEMMSSQSLVFVTDQKVSWNPKVKSEKITLGVK